MSLERLKRLEWETAKIERNPYADWTDEEIDQAVYCTFHGIEPEPELKEKMKKAERSQSFKNRAKALSKYTNAELDEKNKALREQANIEIE